MRIKFSSLFVLLVIASFILAACGGAPQTSPTAASGGATAPTAAPSGEAPTAAPSTGGTALAVGIVLPTKDETRWTQDEARFKEALEKAGYQVEILFSE